MSKRRNKLDKNDSAAEGQKSLIEQARALCASNEVGTVKQLREMARSMGDIDNVGTLTKEQLCAELEKILGHALNAETSSASSSKKRLSFPVEEEDATIPDGCFDMITQEIMYDPIVASDGYSYDRVSLHALFAAEQKRFATNKHASSKPRRVESLRVPGEALKNPFTDIRGWPSSFALFPNRSLRETIVQWLDEHGMSRDRPTDDSAAQHNNKPEKKAVEEEEEGNTYIPHNRQALLRFAKEYKALTERRTLSKSRYSTLLSNYVLPPLCIGQSFLDRSFELVGDSTFSQWRAVVDEACEQARSAGRVIVA
jgi:hypothetical protein